MRPADLARLLGVTDQAVHNWLNGHAYPSDAMAKAIEKHTGVPASAWLRDRETES